MDERDDKVHLRLVEAGDDRVKVSKVIRQYLKFDLKDAVDATRNTPFLLVENMSSVEGEWFKRDLEAAGATVEIFGPWIDVTSGGRTYG